MRERPYDAVRGRARASQEEGIREDRGEMADRRIRGRRGKVGQTLRRVPRDFRAESAVAAWRDDSAGTRSPKGVAATEMALLTSESVISAAHDGIPRYAMFSGALAHSVKCGRTPPAPSGAPVGQTGYLTLTGARGTSQRGLSNVYFAMSSAGCPVPHTTSLLPFRRLHIRTANVRGAQPGASRDERGCHGGRSRRDSPVACQLPSASKVRSRSAATLTAIVAGSLPVMSPSPIGVLIRSMADSS